MNKTHKNQNKTLQNKTLTIYKIELKNEKFMKTIKKKVKKNTNTNKHTQTQLYIDVSNKC